MYDPKSLEIFFNQYLPSFKRVIEEDWTDRKKLAEFLSDCLTCGMLDSWMEPYFRDMMYYVRSAPHTYTNPWSVL